MCVRLLSARVVLLLWVLLLLLRVVVHVVVVTVAVIAIATRSPRLSKITDHSPIEIPVGIFSHPRLLGILRSLFLLFGRDDNRFRLR